MHVVFATNKLINGGGERVLAQLITGVRTAGGAATILFLGTKRALVAEIRAEMEAAGAKVVMATSAFKAVRALQSATSLHLYNVNVYAKMLPLLPLFRRIPVICHVHGAAESANVLARRLFQARWNPCDEIIFVSEAGRTSWGISRGRVVFNPVTFPGPRIAALPAARETLSLLSVNRLVPVKRVAAQLEILARLRGIHGLDARLDIIGEGPELHSLQAHAEGLNLGSALCLIGARSHDDVLRLYPDYDAFLATSAAEGLGLSLIEALAAGLHGFAAPIPAYREVAGVGGGVTFIDPESPQEAAKDIATRATTSSLPVADRTALISAFDEKRFIARMLEFYR